MEAKKEHYLRTLEESEEINTYKELCAVLMEDEATSPPEIAAIIRMVLQTMPPREAFTHVWGTNPERGKVKGVISELRKAISNMGNVTNNRRNPGGY